MPARPQAIVWYNGKTQWTYMKKTNEVNVSNPTQATADVDESIYLHPHLQDGI